MDNDNTGELEAIDIEGTAEVELKTEYRVVCASFGEPGHHEHVYVKDTLETAERFRDIKDNQSRGNPKMAAVEIPFTIEVRMRTDWHGV